MVKKVLFINKTNPASIIPDILAGAGYDVTHAMETDIALHHLETGSYDMVILVENAAINSWMLCEQVRRLSASPLIVISSGASAESCVKAIQAGADFFMRKAFGPMELLARVNTLSQRAPSRQPVPLVS